jgi:hypothetical protein
MKDTWSLPGGEFIGMNFGEIGIVFAEITSADFRHLKYPTAQSVAVDGTLGPGKIGSGAWNTGDNLIGIPDEYPDHLYHIRWNVDPKVDFRVYEWFETTQTGNLDNDTRDKTSDFGYLTGDMLDDHPEYAERIIPYMTRLQFSFYNKRTVATTPDMLFDIYEYIVRYVNPDVQKELSEDLLYANIDRTIFPMGDVVNGLPGYKTAHDIKSKLGVTPMVMPNYTRRN